jgi:L-fucose isomerase-like protein
MIFPQLTYPQPPARNEIVLIASGDQRQDANRVQWPTQADVEARVITAFAELGYTVRRGHAYSPELGHGFIWSQRMGMDVFQDIHPDTPLLVVDAIWQYSHHVLAGLRCHRGPILTIANWSGRWAGLVGILNLNASLTKAGVKYSTLWSEHFDDKLFVEGIRQWIRDGHIDRDMSHVRDLDVAELPNEEARLGKALAEQIRLQNAILGVFDEGCMGMYNAIIDDELLNPMGVYKERLSQSALVAAMRQVTDDEAQEVYDWLKRRGVTFNIGTDPEADLVDDQVLQQCRMYIAAARMARRFGLDAVGIQYQQGLKDMTPASDLAEALLNNPDRPPVCDIDGAELFAGKAIPHFNEADEGAGLDALVTNRVWTALNFDPSTTLHDIRWGEHYTGNGIDDFVWVFMISGAAPASHFVGGYAGATSERQRHVFFPLGGGTLKGVSKPGEIVWSRVFIENGELHGDMGRGTAVELPAQETERRWQATSPEWPILHGVLHGVSRDQMMARHKANHLQVAYAPSVAGANQALAVKAAMMADMGIRVHLCGI